MKNHDEWITNNFESLVIKYGGKYIGVVNDQVISSALTLKEVLNDAKRLGKDEEEVSLLKVPTEEELVPCLRSSFRQPGNLGYLESAVE